jgi:Aldehyde dehydrogenase family
MAQTAKSQHVETPFGLAPLENPTRNKGTAFTEEERRRFGLEGFFLAASVGQPRPPSRAASGDQTDRPRALHLSDRLGRPERDAVYGRIVNRKNFDRLVGLLVDVPVDSPIMQEEVFGPMLPVLEIESVEAVIHWVNSRPRPLGVYVFAEDTGVAERILDATEELPFGGVGNSGMGKYHGRWGFDAFTNARGVLYHSSRIDPGVRYPPYSRHAFERKIQAELMG